MNVVTMNRINEKIKKMTAVRSWQQDLFILRNAEVDKYTKKLAAGGVKEFALGNIGHYTDSQGREWYIIYCFNDEWYYKIKALSRQGKNPILELKAQFREEAFGDGSYYKIMDSFKEEE